MSYYREKGLGYAIKTTLQLETPSCIKDYLSKHRIRLSKTIGEGSYSKVRLCIVNNETANVEEKGEKCIACKVINKKKASGEFVNKFLPRELEIMGRLSHPNIVTVFDILEFDDYVFIFMDFCCKGDLLEFIKRKGFLSERRSQNYFCQILSAVRYLHALDLAHRDLKCENVLLYSYDHLKLSDFGFSRYCHNAKGKRILSNTYCGSAAYAAPEILQGTMYNPKLYDMWSLGCILFIMLTGHMPYDETDVQQMLQHQMDGNINYPPGVEKLISKQAKSLMRHLLEADVTRRATIEQALMDPWVQVQGIQASSKTKVNPELPNAGPAGDYRKQASNNGNSVAIAPKRQQLFPTLPPPSSGNPKSPPKGKRHRALDSLNKVLGIGNVRNKANGIPEQNDRCREGNNDVPCANFHLRGNVKHTFPEKLSSPVYLQRKPNHLNHKFI